MPETRHDGGPGRLEDAAVQAVGGALHAGFHGAGACGGLENVAGRESCSRRLECRLSQRSPETRFGLRTAGMLSHRPRTRLIGDAQAARWAMVKGRFGRRYVVCARMEGAWSTV